MRAPKHKRTNPKHLAVGTPPVGVDLPALAARAQYAGSVYHKDIPSFAGATPRRRPDASVCPRNLAWQQADILEWLRDAIRNGNVGSYWEGNFPRYAWHREGELIFEARLINPSTGQYKGYPLEVDERVRGLT